LLWLVLSKAGILVLGQAFGIELGVLIKVVVSLRLASMLLILPWLRVITVVGFQQGILVAMADLSSQGNVALLLRAVLLYCTFAGVFIAGIAGLLRHDSSFLRADDLAEPGRCLRVNKRKSLRRLTGIVDTKSMYRRELGSAVPQRHVCRRL
jgi:hypothetical protein